MHVGRAVRTSSRGVGVGGAPMAYHYVFTISLGIALVGSVGTLLAAFYAWGAFLDANEHDPRRVRAVMFLALVLAATAETSLACSSGLFAGWVAWLLAVANVWGGLDAVLRFPASHSLGSLFSVKQLLLLAAKALAFAAGLRELRRHAGLFAALLLLDVAGPAMLYLMALPLDTREQVALAGAYDVDVLVRAWQLATRPSECATCAADCRRWWYRRLTAAAEASPAARRVVCAASAEHRRALGRRARAV
mmetsp:Transcript_119132/g.323205  ORF Transcript_119132/g.323205 Transcript_119132/m.323205 type:complete len:249 (+) Transcript_119132:39-785(+)